MKAKKFFSAILSAVVLTATASAFTVNAVTPSDPNGDGSILVSDATYIMSYLNGQFEPTDLDALDFDRNGVISQMDYETVYMYLTHTWEG